MADTTIHITQWGITVMLAPSGNPLIADCNAPPDGTAGTPYTHTFLASGGTPPYTFAIIAGSLPPGLVMDTSGNVTGTPLLFGLYPFTLQVTDSTATTATVDCSILINPGPLGISCNNPPDGNVGAPYTHSFLATFGVPPYVFSIVTGSLPVGLFMDFSGNVTGTPFIAGTSDFTVQVTDSTSTSVEVDCSITIIGVAILPAGSASNEGRCRKRNEFDCCLEHLALNWRRITFPPLCAIPKEMYDLYPYPWDEDTQNPVPIPKGAVPVRQAKGITTPATAAGDQTILSYVVPQGYDALITSFWFSYSGTGFVQGSGDLLFRIQQNQRYLKGLSNVPFLIGAPKFPCPMTEGQIVMSGSLLRVIVNVPNLSGLILVGASTVSGGLQGFLWAR